MKLIRLIVLFVLVLGCIIVGSSLYGLSLQAAPTPQPPSTTPTRTLSALKFDLKKFQQTLDRNDIVAAVEQIETGWKQQYEDYYQGQLTGQLLSTEQIAQSLDQTAQLTGKKAALIYAISTPEQLELILLSPHGKPQHQRITAANRPQLIKTVNTFRHGIVNPNSRPSDYLPAAQQLYQWLITPLAAELKAQQIDTLIFCLGGGLRSIPMAALHDGQRFLTQNYNLAIIPAFGLLDRHVTHPLNTKVLAMGASQFRQANSLPAVPVELVAISRFWAGESWLNRDFTLAKLKARRLEYPFGIIHLATHATFAPGSVENSYIQFWDRQLLLKRLPDLGLRVPAVQLLVLSACRTALGDPNAEIGFAGLAVQSGAKAALASLWSVDDVGTLVLMANFYQHLKTAPIKAEALRQAQLAMLNGEARLSDRVIQQAIAQRSLSPDLLTATKVDLSRPYYWAAFTLIGNPW